MCRSSAEITKLPTVSLEAIPAYQESSNCIWHVHQTQGVCQKHRRGATSRTRGINSALIRLIRLVKPFLRVPTAALMTVQYSKQVFKGRGGGARGQGSFILLQHPEIACRAIHNNWLYQTMTNDEASDRGKRKVQGRGCWSEEEVTHAEQRWIFLYIYISSRVCLHLFQDCLCGVHLCKTQMQAIH